MSRSIKNQTSQTSQTSDQPTDQATLTDQPTDEATLTDQPTDEATLTDQPTEEEAIDYGARWAALVDEAIDGAAPGVGTLSAVALDTLKSGWAALPKSDRSGAEAYVTSILASASAALATDPTNAITRLAAATNIRLAVDGWKVTKATKAPVAPADPIPTALEAAWSALVAMSALSAHLEAIVAPLSDDQRQRLSDIGAALLAGDMSPASDWRPTLPRFLVAESEASDEAPASYAVTVASKATRAKSSGTKAPRAAGAGQRDLAAEVLAYLTEHGATKYGAIAGAIEASAGAVANAVAKGRVAGWQEGAIDGAKGAVASADEASADEASADEASAA